MASDAEESTSQCLVSSEEQEEPPADGTEDTDGVPYDRGWAWVVVAGNFINYVLISGYVKSSGVFFVELLRHFGASTSKTSLLFAIRGAFYSITGFFVMNAVVGRLGTRRTVLIGAVLMSLSAILSSLANELTLLICLQAVLLGMADCMLTSPGEVLTAAYFRSRRYLAMAVCKTGASVGSVLYPLMLTRLLAEYGLRGALLLTGAVSLHSLPAALLLRPTSFYRKLAQKRGRGRRRRTCREEEEEEKEEESKEEEIVLVEKEREEDKVEDDIEEDAIVREQDGEEEDDGKVDVSKEATYSKSAIRPRIAPENVHEHIHVEREALGQREVEVAWNKADNPHTKITHQRNSKRSSCNSNTKIIHEGNSKPTCWNSQTEIPHEGSSKHSTWQTDMTHEGHSKPTFSNPQTEIPHEGHSKPPCWNSNREIPLEGNSKHTCLNSLTEIPLELNPKPTSLNAHLDSTAVVNPNPQRRTRLPQRFLSVFSFLDFSLFRRASFRPLFVYFMLAPTINVAVDYLPAVARDNHLTDLQAAQLLSIVGGVDMASRFLSGVLADLRLVPVPCMVSLALFLLGVVYQCVSLLTSFPLLALLAAAQGVLGGAVHCMVSVVVLHVVGMRHLARGIGFQTLAEGAFSAAFHPLCGFIRDKTGSYAAVYHVIGCAVMTASFLLILVEFLRRREKAEECGEQGEKGRTGG